MSARKTSPLGRLVPRLTLVAVAAAGFVTACAFEAEEGKRSDTSDAKGIATVGGFGAAGSTSTAGSGLDGGPDGGDGGLGRCAQSCRLAAEPTCQQRCVAACGVQGCDVAAFPFEQATAVRCGAQAVEYYVVTQGKTCPYAP